MTNLKLKNGTKKETVDTYITLGATPGCVQDVDKLILSGGKKITKLADLQGHFELAPEELIEISAPEGEGLNGAFSFNTPPENCPTESCQMGVNLAEFIINNGFQEGNPQETIDISGVCGVNAIVKFHLEADDWATNGGAIPVKDFENGLKGDNTGRIGVYPYGCDDCTASVNPPECVGLQPQNANAEPICNVQRDAKSNEGGTVEVIFLGTVAIA